MTGDETGFTAMRDAHADAQDEDRLRLRNFIQAQMGAAKPPMSRLGLAKAAGIDRDTLANFLDGKSWPQPSRRSALEAAMGLVPGTFDRVLAGQDPESVNTGQTAEFGDDDYRLSELIVRFHASALSDLSPAEREEVEAAAKAAALQRIREIRGL